MEPQFGNIAMENRLTWSELCAGVICLFATNQELAQLLLQGKVDSEFFTRGCIYDSSVKSSNAIFSPPILLLPRNLVKIK